MSNQIQSVRGMNDILPGTTDRWQRVEQIARMVLSSYGYHEIRLPIMEQTALFARSIGEDTDIVEKEMYTFTDRNGDSLTLRPEGTVGCVRAGLENGMLVNQIQRLWYQGPMFRHERPQKGRYRQFHQIGVEAFGMTGPDIDAEMILLTARLWQALGLTGLTLQINSLGTAEARKAYREKLLTYLQQRRDDLDEDSLRRLTRNPLRILDSKNPVMDDVITNAPTLTSSLDDDSRRHFENLCHYLDHSDIAYEVNPHLVRGLDYYTNTVFEWVSRQLGAQDAVCAGGRYDTLVEQLGGCATPAIGFAIGLERLLALIPESHIPSRRQTPHAYLIMAGDGAIQTGLRLAEALREALPGLIVLTNCGAGSFKSQFKRADKSGASLAIVIGEDEAANNQVTVKHLRDDCPQQTLACEELIPYLKQQLTTGITT